MKDFGFTHEPSSRQKHNLCKKKNLWEQKFVRLKNNDKYTQLDLYTWIINCNTVFSNGILQIYKAVINPEVLDECATEQRKPRLYLSSTRCERLAWRCSCWRNWLPSADNLFCTPNLETQHKAQRLFCGSDLNKILNNQIASLSSGSLLPVWSIS